MQLRAQIEREKKAQQAAAERIWKADGRRTLVRRAKSPPSSELQSCIVDPCARRGSYCSGTSDRRCDTFETAQSDMVVVNICAVQAMLKRDAQLMALLNKKGVLKKKVSQSSSPNDVRDCYDEHVAPVSLRAPSNSLGRGAMWQGEHGEQTALQHEALRGRLANLQDQTDSVLNALGEKLEAVRKSHGQVKALQAELDAVEQGKHYPRHPCVQREDTAA